MFNGPYIEWNQKRIKSIVEYYDHKFFFDKSILDLGCGYADISGVLHHLGANVTALDARQEHLKIVGKKFPGIKIVQSDLDRDWPFFGKTFDMILHLGLLCHLNNYEIQLKRICSSTNHLILETAVCDSDDSDKCVSLSENKGYYDLSVNGISTRPTAAAIEKVLTNCGMSFKRIDNAKFNAGPYKYDWLSKNKDECDFFKRRIWFCVKTNNDIIIPFSDLNLIKPSQLSNNENFIPQILQNSKIPIINPLILSKSPKSPTNPFTSPSTSTSHEIENISQPLLTTQFVQPLQTSASVLENPKTALVLHGHMRTIERCYPSFIRRILNDKPDGVDVFIHTWETMGAKQSRGRTHDNELEGILTSSKLQKITDLIKPKAIIVEKYDIQKNIQDYADKINLTLQEKQGFYGDNLTDYFSMLFSMKQVCVILEKYEQENNIKYDVIIKSRPDILILDNFDPKKLSYSDRICYTPSSATHYNNGMNDQLAFGNANVIKKYLSLYDDVIHYLNNRSIKPLRPETLLKYHMGLNNIQINTLGLRYYIIRANGGILVPEGIHQKVVFDQNLIKNIGS